MTRRTDFSPSQERRPAFENHAGWACTVAMIPTVAAGVSRVRAGGHLSNRWPRQQARTCKGNWTRRHVSKGRRASHRAAKLAEAAAQSDYAMKRHFIEAGNWAGVPERTKPAGWWSSLRFHSCRMVGKRRLRRAFCLCPAANSEKAKRWPRS